MDSITILAPAKLNLALDITGRLPNGYHDLDMLMQAVNLYERITVRRADTLSLKMPGSSLPGNEQNIAWKAAQAFLDYTGLFTGAALTVEKHTPVQAGMGGGSADAAGVLVGMNELYADMLPRRLSLCELLALGAPLGADVPFALLGGTCRVQGIGDKMRALPPMPQCSFVIIKPEYGVPTPQAFAAYDTLPQPPRPNLEAMEQAICQQDLAGVCAHTGNVLETVAGHDTEAIRQALLAAGAKAARMTGSGAAVFGVFAARDEALTAAKALQARYRQVYVAQPERGGPHREYYMV